MITSLSFIIAITLVAIAFVATTVIPITSALAQQFAQPANPNDWGKVVSSRAQEEGRDFGAHTSDPVASIPGREVPRDGVGNVQVNDNEIPKHPAFHANELCVTFPNAAGCDAIDASDDPIRSSSDPSQPVAPQGSSLPTLQQMQGQ